MSLTVGEAVAVNTLVGYLLERPQTLMCEEAPSDADAKKAAEFLADKASKSLGAGLHAGDVRKYWKKKERKP